MLEFLFVKYIFLNLFGALKFFMFITWLQNPLQFIILAWHYHFRVSFLDVKDVKLILKCYSYGKNFPSETLKFPGTLL